MSTFTLTARDGCYCKAARQLIGKNITAESITSNAKVNVVTVTEIRHGARDDGCWIVLDGAWTRSLRTRSGNPLAVDVTDAPADVEAQARAPFSAWGGMVTLEDAAEVIRQAWAAHATMANLVPVRPGAPGSVRRAFAPDPPQVPESSRSYYTRGRVRRVPATGRWAADLGHAGATRPLGEYDTIDEARAVVEAAHGKAWDTLEAWLRRHVPGDWVLARLPLSVDVEDRLSIGDVARVLGVAEGTVRGYRSRGQMPAADSPAGTRSPWWDRSTITGWVRGGQGARTDLRT